MTDDSAGIVVPAYLSRVYDETSDEHFARVAPTIHALRKDA